MRSQTKIWRWSSSVLAEVADPFDHHHSKHQTQDLRVVSGMHIVSILKTTERNDNRFHRSLTSDAAIKAKMVGKG
jgi:hypothetical protein